MRKCKCEHWQSCPECTSAVRLAQLEIERLRTEVGRVKYSERMHAEALDTATQGYERLRAEIKQLQTEIKALREVIISAAHTLEQARIWGGGTWHWNINANACQRAWKILDAALAAKEDI